MIISLAIKACRYYLLVNINFFNLPFYSFITPFLVGYSFSVLGPFKIGEVVSIEVNKQSRSIPRTNSIAALAVFRIFDLLITLTIFAMSFITTIPKVTPKNYHLLLFITFIVCIIGLILLGIVLFYPPIGRKLGHLLIKLLGLFSKKTRNFTEVKIMASIDMYYASLRTIIQQKRITLLVFAMTITRWLIEFFAYQLTVYAFSIKIGYIDVCTISTISLFVGLLSMMPAGLGTSTLTSQALLEAMNAEPLQAAGAIICQSIIGPGLIVLSGFIASLFIKKKRYTNKKSIDEN